MPQAINGTVITMIAQSAVGKYLAVNAAGAPAASGIYGITLADAAAGQAVPVVLSGTAIATAGAAIPAGTATLICDANGRVVPGGAANACVGRLCQGQSAAAAGDLVEIIVAPSI